MVRSSVAPRCEKNRGTLLIRNSLPLEPDISTLPWPFGDPTGRGLFLISEVHLQVRKASSMRDVEFASHTCPIGWPLVGLSPHPLHSLSLSIYLSGFSSLSLPLSLAPSISVSLYLFRRHLPHLHLLPLSSFSPPPRVGVCLSLSAPPPSSTPSTLPCHALRS